LFHGAEEHASCAAMRAVNDLDASLVVMLPLHPEAPLQRQE
jgi:hypothetical protein